MVSNGILLIGALVLGWFLAGEPTNIQELRSGINRLTGGDGGVGMGPAGGPYGSGPPPSPMGSNPEVEAIKKQLQEKDQQTALQQMQQQFQQQMMSQQTQASQQQLQQQLQQLQLAGASGAMGLPGGTGAGVNPAAAAAGASPLTNPATTTVAAADAANQVPASQQMLPAAASAVAPGVIPGQQTGYTSPYGGTGVDPMTGMPYGGGTSYTDPTGGLQSLQQSIYGGPNPSGVPTMALPGSGYPYGGYGGGGGYPPTYGSPGLDTYMGTRFASNIQLPTGPINIQSPIVSPVPNVAHPSPIVPTDYRRRYDGYRSHLGIVDHMHHMGRPHPVPFFHGHHHLMGMDLGVYVPPLYGVTLADLIAFTDSRTGKEIFPLGIDRYDDEAFRDDILAYVYRIMRNMSGHSPQERMRILRELILAAAYERGQLPPDITTYQNLLSKVPTPIGPAIFEAPHGPRFVNQSGYVLPSKYAVLQFKDTNSMPPMVHQHGIAGPRGNIVNRNTGSGHSLFFDINET